MYKSPLREKVGKFYVTGISFTIIISLAISNYCTIKVKTTRQKKHFGHVVVPTGTVCISILSLQFSWYKVSLYKCKAFCPDLCRKGDPCDNMVSISFSVYISPPTLEFVAWSDLNLMGRQMHLKDLDAFHESSWISEKDICISRLQKGL